MTARIGRWREWLPWLPAAIAAIFLVAFAIDLRDVILALYRNSDTASGPVIAELLHQAPDGRQVTLGNYPWYESLWFMTATRGLPGHRAIWELAPFAFTAIGYAAVVWSVRAALDRWAARIVLAVLAVPSVLLVDFIGSYTVHGHTMVHACLIGAAVTLVAARGAHWSTGRTAAAGVAVGLVSAPGVASDQLLLFAGIVPLCVAGIAVAAVERRQRMLWFAGIAALLALAVGPVLQAIARNDGIDHFPLELAFATSQNVFGHARLLWEVLVAFGHGDFFGRLVDAASVLALLGAAIVTGVLVVVARRARALRPADVRAVDSGRLALLAFWGTAFAVSAAIFVLSWTPVDKFGGRYILSAWVALVVLGVAAVRMPRERLVAAAVASALGVLGFVTLLNGDYEDSPRPVTQAAANEIGRYVRAEHADHGYAAYWVAATLTWQSKFAARTYPVWECTAPSHTLCPFKFHQLDTWYVPRPGVRTFIVIDLTNADPAITDPDPKVYGRPVAQRGFGTLNVLVYDYDVAEKITGPGAPARS
jgi:hypothetical protein